MLLTCSHALNVTGELKFFLDKESASLAHAACTLKKAATLVEALQAKNLKQDDLTDERYRRIQELEGALNLLERNAKDYEQEMSIMKGKLELFGAIATEKENLQTQVGSLSARSQALEASIEAKDATIAELKEDNKRHNRVNAQLRKTVSSMENKMNEEKRYKEEALETVAALTNEVDELKKEISQYNAARALFVQSTETQAGIQVRPNLFTPRNASSSNKKRKTTLTANA